MRQDLSVLGQRYPNLPDEVRRFARRKILELSLHESLLLLRPGRINGPLVPGERSPECYLSVIAEAALPGFDLAFLGADLARAGFDERYRRLLTEISGHYVAR